MTESLYPITTREDDLIRNLQEIQRLRETEDVPSFLNLPERFVLGRGRFRTRAAPSSPSDVLATDQEGDIVNDDTYEYKLLTVSGNLRWDRRLLDTSW